MKISLHQLKNILIENQVIIYKSIVEWIIYFGVLIWGGLYDTCLKQFYIFNKLLVYDFNALSQSKFRYKDRR